ncbi:UDP-N-acetylmuramoyl-tripeptide--D-alanyl-D-alanine ligase [soil metagenome]
MREWPATVTRPPTHQSSAGAAPGFDGPGLAAVTGGFLVQAADRPVRGGAVDSRRVTPDACFFALPGERTDGHRFLEEAVTAGAAALVVTEPLLPRRVATLVAGHPGGVSIVQVTDALAALQATARAWRARFTPLTVGITGSLAKTSTKEQIAEVLAERWRVLRSEGNENNEVGLPLTLLRLSAEHEVAVLEMGMYVSGEIGLLADLAQPTIGVVTAVRGTHLSRAGSIDAIEEGKSELVRALPAEGTAVLNADDARVVRMSGRTPASVLTYGFSEAADVRAEEVESLAERGMSFVLCAAGQRRRVTTSALGRHSVHNALAAAAVGLASGLDLDAITRGLARGFAAPHRTALIAAGQWRILDDSYNAAPDSMAAALHLLSTLPGRRVAVLGEMLELGETSAEAHQTVGRLVAGIAELLVTVGPAAAAIAEGARAAGLEAGRVFETTDRTSALAVLLQRLRPGDVILVKASRGAALDWLVERLTALPDASPA